MDTCIWRSGITEHKALPCAEIYKAFNLDKKTRIFMLLAKNSYYPIYYLRKSAFKITFKTVSCAGKYPGNHNIGISLPPEFV